MLRFVGCDVHKRTAVFTILLSDGALFATYTVPVTREALAAFAERQLTAEGRLAMEATTNTWAVAGVLRPIVKEIVIGNPLKVRAIAEAKIKTDKVDSRVLAELFLCDYLPVVWQPDEETQRLRRLTHRRAALVSDRTRLKNRLHSILHHCLIPLPACDLFSKRGLTWLRQVPLAQEEALARESDLRLLELTELEIAELDQLLVREAWQDEKVRLVMSIPGIDYTVAQTCLAAIGEISRFPNAKKLSAYLGLNPSTRQSGPHCYHGPITKQGNAHARWLLVQAAQHLAQYRGPLGQTMRRMVKKKPQRSGGCVREKAGRAALARAEFGRTVSLCGTEDAAGQVLAAARACHGEAAKRRSCQRHTAITAVWVWANAGSAFASTGARGKWPARSRPTCQGRERVMLDIRFRTNQNTECSSPLSRI